MGGGGGGGGGGESKKGCCSRCCGCRKCECCSITFLKEGEEKTHLATVVISCSGRVGSRVVVLGEFDSGVVAVALIREDAVMTADAVDVTGEDQKDEHCLLTFVFSCAQEL